MLSTTHASRRRVALLLAVAMVHTSIACTTTRSVAMSPTPPAPEATNVKIVGVTTIDGDSYSFREPAQLAPGIDAPDMLIGQAATEYQGTEAWAPLELAVNQIAEYELATEKKEMGVAGFLGIVFVVGLVAILGKGMDMDLNGVAGAFGPQDD